MDSDSLANPGQGFFRKHRLGTATVVGGILVPVLYLYLQLVVWKRHGDDLMLTAIGIVVTLLLWAMQVICIVKYWKDARREIALLSEIITIKEDHKVEVKSLNDEVLKWKVAFEQEKINFAQKEKDSFTREAEANAKISEAFKSQSGEWSKYIGLLSPLQLEALQMAKDIRDFLNEIGPRPIVEPNPEINSQEAANDYRQRQLDLHLWVERLLHGYAAQFSDKITNLMHRLAAENIPTNSWELRGRSIANETELQMLIDELLNMAIKLSYPRNQRHIKT